MNPNPAEAWAARPMGTMTCKDCQETKPLTDFYFNASKRDYNAYCKPCHNVRSQAGRKRKSDYAEILEAELEAVGRCRCRQPATVPSMRRAGMSTATSTATAYRAATRITAAPLPLREARA